MKNWLIVFGLLSLLLACTPPKEAPPEVKLPSLGNIDISSDVKVIPPSPEEQGLGKEVEEFFSRQFKISNYEYFLTSKKVKVDTDNDLVYIEYESALQTSKGIFYDRVIIDRKNSKRTVWCVKSLCERDSLEKAYRIEYENTIDTPLDFAKSFKAAWIDLKKPQLVQNNEAVFISFIDKTNRKGEAWFHSYYALPLKYTLNGETIEYKDMGINPALWKPIEVPSNYQTIEG